MSTFAVVAPVLVLLAMVVALAWIDAAPLRRALTFFGLGAAAVMISYGIGDPSLDEGVRVLGGFVQADRFARVASLVLLVGVAGVLALGRAKSSGTRRELIISCGGIGGLVTLHAGDLLVAWLGLEIVAISGFALILEDARGEGRTDVDQIAPAAFALAALSLLAVALLYAGLSTTRFEGLGSRTSTIFTHWGAMQRYVLVLEGRDEVPPGLRAQALDKIVRGLAPAAVFMAGLLLWLATLLARAGLVPFPGSHRSVFERAALDTIAFQLVVAPVVVFGLLLRVYVGSFHAPRLVTDPYGWVGAMPTIAVATIAYCAYEVLRTRDPVTLVLASVRLVFGELLLFAVASAGFHGLRSRTKASPIQPADAAEWARAMGDEATAALLFALSMVVIAGLGALAVVSLVDRDRGFVAFDGLAYRRPVAAVCLAVCMGTLAGFPLTAGLPAQFMGLRVLVIHGSMAWFVLPALAGLCAVGVQTVRLVARMWERAPVRDEPEAAVASRVMAFVAGLTLLALGLVPDPAIESARRTVAGLTIPLGSAERAKWIRGPRPDPGNVWRSDARR